MFINPLLFASLSEKQRPYHVFASRYCLLFYWSPEISSELSVAIIIKINKLGFVHTRDYFKEIIMNTLTAKR